LWVLTAEQLDSPLKMKQLSSMKYLIYGLIILNLAPIIQWEMGKNDTRDNHYPGSFYNFLVWYRIFFCGPILFILGLALIILYKSWYHKIAGLMAISTGVYWMVSVWTTPL